MPGDTLQIAQIVDAAGMPLPLGFRYIGVPVDVNDGDMMQHFRVWVKAHAKGIMAGFGVEEPSLRNIRSSNDLWKVERHNRLISLYLWMAQRWPKVFYDETRARDAQRRVSRAISDALAAKVDLARECSSCGKILPPDHKFSICDRCYHERSDYYF